MLSPMRGACVRLPCAGALWPAPVAPAIPATPKLPAAANADLRGADGSAAVCGGIAMLPVAELLGQLRGMLVLVVKLSSGPPTPEADERATCIAVICCWGAPACIREGAEWGVVVAVLAEGVKVGTTWLDEVPWSKLADKPPTETAGGKVSPARWGEKAAPLLATAFNPW